MRRRTEGGGEEGEVEKAEEEEEEEEEVRKMEMWGRIRSGDKGGGGRMGGRRKNVRPSR